LLTGKYKFISRVRINIILILQIILLVSCRLKPEEKKNSDIKYSFKECRLDSLMSFDAFDLAMRGMNRINGIRNKNIITIIDFTKPSIEDRFFVIDLKNNRILYKTLAAHGRGSGENYAVSFSNEPHSLKSCLGFFLTSETYTGINGYSLSLDGLEPGINDKARTRAIVIHGADYVSSDFAEKYGRIGRSWGCPALPAAVSGEIIDLISGGSCLFIYGSDPQYLKNSSILTGESRDY
jgi:hypothetical protein